MTNTAEHTQRRAVLTIGHSNHLIERFLSLLHEHGVTAVADVRSSPYSRFHPQFNRKSLEQALSHHGIEYALLGAELGARSKDPRCYEDGKVQYRRLAQTELFRSGLTRLIELSGVHRVALLCAEKEPLDCHRTFLVGSALEEHGFAMSHIHADGSLETSQDAMHRLLGLIGESEADLFRMENERIAEACALQEQRIAYVDRSMRDDARI